MDILSDTLAALRTGRPSVVRTEARAPWGVRFQPVSGAGFHVVVEGRCVLLPVDGEPIALGPGDVVFLRRGTGHAICDAVTSEPVAFVPARVDTSSPIGSFTVEGGGTRSVLVCGAYHLDTDRPHPLLGDLPEIVHLPASPGRHPVLRSAVDQLCAEIHEPRPGSDAVVAALVDLLLLYILRSWYDEVSGDRTRGWASALNDPLIAPALRAIHDDPAHPWTVESLGNRAGLSRAAFARRFASVVGEPPLSYLTTWRMAIAARMLRETGDSLNEVAENAGYTSEFAFARAFKRHFGAPPGAYRREWRTASAL
ncbi:AraC family transcriptional regulator [Kitasatospora sp. NPDC089913]|uniref:AraC family transcriptional regulator n=1 Tax=Streptomycetaceae TaxID=2062 RepID=UPI00087C657E|nr:AraC family transcriptional regulator [Streptomyces sp. TLI_053]SDT80850.1 transcriptional regulator, AraC family [Streptomyces sp. TLI_053]